MPERWQPMTNTGEVFLAVTAIASPIQCRCRPVVDFGLFFDRERRETDLFHFIHYCT